MTQRLLILFVGALALCPGPVRGQVASADGDVVDRVVAIVGDSVILMTQVQEEIERLRLQGATIPTDAAGMASMQQEVLDTWVNRVLVLQAAANDTLIEVDEERVEEIVSGEIDQRTQQFGGQPQFQEALGREGLTIASYRDILRQQVRQEQVQQLFMQRALQDAATVEVSEDQLLEAFQQARGQLQQRPRLLSIEQVVMVPEPADSAWEAARARAAEILVEVQAGADFATLAQEHSQDPGSAAQGGDLGWFRRGAMVREFEDAAFMLIDGQVSDLVRTDFGYHIIKIERSRLAERQGRHILIMPERTQEDLVRARVLADSVVAMARAGTPMAELFDEYSDPLAPDTLTVPFDQLSELPPGYAALQSATAGEVVGPLEYETGPGETRLSIVRVREIREAGAYTYEDVKPQLAEQLQRSLQIEALLAALRANTHIEIRM
jgi:peptidyl-prolyl cis-trans isomerase SurA